MTQYLDIFELAELLQESTACIRRKMRTAPRDVPPRVYFSGTQLLRWKREEVDSWLFERRELGLRR